LTPLENLDGIDLSIRRIDSEIEPPFVFENKQYQLKASIGSALIPKDGIEPDKLLEIADQRMYVVKQSRKNSC